MRHSETSILSLCFLLLHHRGRIEVAPRTLKPSAREEMFYVSKRKHRKSKHFDPNRKDWHHILYQKRYYCTGYAKRLREPPYCGAYIPQMTLHRQIHEVLSNVPLPDGKYCKIAYDAIVNWLEAGYISLNDPIEKRIDTLIKCFIVNCPKTAKALLKQKEIVARFYEGRQ